MQAQTGYFDIHCHILPQVDDGAASMEMALEMLQMEYGQGVRTVLLTPHYAAGQGNIEKLRLRYQQLQAESAGRYPGLELLLGSELMYTDSMVDELTGGIALTLAQTDYVLTEFPIDISWKAMQSAFRRLAECSYRPVLAHMERFRCLDGQLGRVDSLISQGVLLQMNSSSVSGGMFDRRASYCRKLVASGRIHLLGTDAHRTDWRPPDMGTAAKELKRKIKDGELLENLLHRNPAKMLANEYIR